MNKGIFFAISAAILNAFVGVFSLSAFDTGISAGSVAFYKSLLALILLTVLVLITPKQRKAFLKLLPHAPKIALLAFCGIFLLYFFETRAYQYSGVSVVTFTLLGTSTLTTFVASHFLLKTPYSIKSLLSMLLAVSGLIIFHSATATKFSFDFGFIFAVSAGIGYGLFLVLSKKNPSDFHGIAMLWWLLMFGSLFLSSHFIFSPLELPSFHGWLYILLLGGASTIGGFYCTTKALSLASATTVQLFELNEPLFASILAFIFYKQSITAVEMFGGLLILAAIYIASKDKDVSDIDDMKKNQLLQKLNPGV